MTSMAIESAIKLWEQLANEILLRRLRRCAKRRRNRTLFDVTPKRNRRGVMSSVLPECQYGASSG